MDHNNVFFFFANLEGIECGLQPWVSLINAALCRRYEP
jgi:hypothetical protein